MKLTYLYKNFINFYIYTLIHHLSLHSIYYAIWMIWFLFTPNVFQYSVYIFDFISCLPYVVVTVCLLYIPTYIELYHRAPAYACPVWGYLANVHKKKLQSLPDRGLRLEANVPRRFSRRLLRSGSGVRSLDDTFRRLAPDFMHVRFGSQTIL